MNLGIRYFLRILALKFTLGYYQCKAQGKKLCCQPLPYGVLSDELRRNGERDKYDRVRFFCKHSNIFEICCVLRRPVLQPPRHLCRAGLQQGRGVRQEGQQVGEVMRSAFVINLLLKGLSKDSRNITHRDKCRRVSMGCCHL